MDSGINSSQIIKNRNEPKVLETLYRNNPEGFAAAFQVARAEYPDEPIFAVWQERLNYEANGVEKKNQLEKSGGRLMGKDLMVMGLLATLAGLSTRLLLYLIDQQNIAPANLIFGIAPFMAAYFVYENKPSKPLVYTLAGLFGGAAVYLNLLPVAEKDSIMLAYLHLPVFLWVLVGLAFTGQRFQSVQARLAYLRFNGAFGILYATMAISGMLLTALTMALFELVGMDISEFYFNNVVVFGAAALAVAGCYLVSGSLKLARNMAPYIAKIFSPLVLATLLAYLATAGAVGKNPFLDRNFLIAFNGVLLSVLAVTIFSLAESGAEEKRRLSDYINAALIGLALLVDTVALAAILFRLSSYGITPNRIAALGVNLLIWVNLLWTGRAYLGFLKGKSGVASVQETIAKYLPVYGLWAAFVVIVFPILFQ